MSLSSERFGPLKASKASLIALLLLGIVSTVYVHNDVFDALDGGSDSRVLRMLKKKKKKKSWVGRCRPGEMKSLVWLLSYPGAGESEVMDLVEDATEKSMATNYGTYSDTGDHYLQQQCYHSGPFKNNMDYPADTTSVLVRTHCSGHCIASPMGDCRRREYMRLFFQPRRFVEYCARGTEYDPVSKRTKGTKPYVKHTSIKKMVLLVRDPVAMVGARMAEVLGSEVKTLQRRTFDAYCKKMDSDKWISKDLYKTILKHVFDNASKYKKEAKELMDSVPCASEFLRIAMWYEKNLGTLRSNGKVVYWEDLYSDKDKEGQALLDFIELEKVSGKKGWMMDKNAKKNNELLSELVTKEVHGKILAFMQKVSDVSYTNFFERYAK